MLKAITISSDKTLKHCEHTITLDFNQRYRRRCLMTTDDGCEFMLSLPNATVLKQGDILELTDGTLVLVQAAEEEVLDIQTKDSRELLRIAWSLGNRHLPIQILSSTSLRIHYDRLLEEEFSQLKVTLKRHKVPFSPHSSFQEATHAHA